MLLGSSYLMFPFPTRNSSVQTSNISNLTYEFIQQVQCMFVEYLLYGNIFS